MRRITPAPLTADAFAPFGEVIGAEAAREVRAINDGHTQRFHALATLDLAAQGGRPIVSIFRSTPLPAPLVVRALERHPLSSQTFVPLSSRPYLVVVAPPGDFDVSAIRVFRAEGQGVNFRAGTWHHFNLALEAVSDFLVIDREADDENCDVATLAEADRIELAP